MNPSNAIILAAGMGMRLNPLTENMPKCLIQINGSSLIERCISKFVQNGIKTVVIVIGYQGHKIKQTLGDTYAAAKLIYIENPDYQTTNNIVSLWLARDYLKQGAFIIEGDIIFEDSALSKLFRNAGGSLWLADRFKKGMDGCLLTTGGADRIMALKIIREKLAEYNGNMFKSAGILKIDANNGRKLSQFLDKEVQENNKNIYYDLVLSKYIDKINISVCNIEGLKWSEIDNAADLQSAEELFIHEKNGL